MEIFLAAMTQNDSFLDLIFAYFIRNHAVKMSMNCKKPSKMGVFGGILAIWAFC